MEWYNPNTRNLPWKQTNDAYKIWLSEVILQQTRVEQGMPYYKIFIQHYPTVRHLAAAPLDDVLKLWEGLGYYSRARNLHKAAQQIVLLHKGNFPNDYAAILALSGIGSYTAAAIASFAFQLPYAVLDGNVFRVLSRVFGIATPIDTPKGKKQFAILAQQILDKKHPDIHNQAIMDLGALVCKPRQPLCNQCPFSTACKALEKDLITKLPVKINKIVKANRFFKYYIIYDNQFVYIQKRENEDIWKGLYEFPYIETTNEISEIEHKIQTKEQSTLNNYIKKLHAEYTPYCYTQTLSHQHIKGSFYEIKLKSLLSPPKGWLCIAKTALKEYAFPKIIRSYLEDRLNYLS